MLLHIGIGTDSFCTSTLLKLFKRSEAVFCYWKMDMDHIDSVVEWFIFFRLLALLIFLSIAINLILQTGNTDLLSIKLPIEARSDPKPTLFTTSDLLSSMPPQHRIGSRQWVPPNTCKEGRWGASPPSLSGLCNFDFCFLLRIFQSIPYSGFK